jgi:hypothetical protein
MFVFFARRALRRGPVLVLDGEGLTVVAEAGKGRRIRWGDVDAIYVNERPGVYGIERHTLVCRVRRSASASVQPNAIADPIGGADEEPVELPLEMLSMDWNDVVKAIQDRLGRRVVLDPRRETSAH